MNYGTGIRPPHQVNAQWLYDEASGFYRELTASDYGGGANAVTNTKLQTSNGLSVNALNPMPVRVAGSSSTAFGETLVSQQDPQIEAYAAAAYDIREWEIFSGANDGYVNVASGQAELEIGSALLAYSTLRTKDFVPYAPGQGMQFRFTAAFDTGAPDSSLQLAGPYHAEDGFAVGYNGSQFGIMHRYGRKLHTTKLSLTSQATSAGNVTITLNGTPNTVPVQANIGVSGLARDIATGINYLESGVVNFAWQAYPISGDVYFMRETHGPVTGAFTYGAGATSSAATVLTFQSGLDGNVDWIYQSGFSYDTLTGDGPSSMTLAPENLNVFEIKMGWLGSLPIKFSIANESCQEMVPFHVIQWTNQNDTPSVEDPRFPVSFALASAGSTTPMKMKTASSFGAIEGVSNLKHKQFSSSAEKTATQTETPILSLLNNRFNLQEGGINRRRFYVNRISLTNESSTKAATVNVYAGLITNLQHFQFPEPANKSSIVLVDKSADAVLSDPNLIKIESFGVAPASNSVVKLEKYIVPKEVLIITVQTSSSTAPIIASVVGWEDV